jgi:tetratricopeptide (TPR) repeat protein
MSSFYHFILILFVAIVLPFSSLLAQNSGTILYEEIKTLIENEELDSALSLSLGLIEKDPDNQGFKLQYADIHFELKNYTKAIEVYKNIEKDYRYFLVRHKLAISYLYNNQKVEAAKILINDLQMKFHKDQNYIVRDLVNYGFEIGIAYDIFKNEDFIHDFFKKYNDPNFYTYSKGRLVRLYNNGGLELIEQNELKKASELLHRSADLSLEELNLKSKYSKKYRIYREKNLANALDYFMVNPPDKATNIHIENNLVTVFKAVDVKFKNKNGNIVEIRDETNWKDTIIYKRNAEICKYFYYYITEGKVLMEFDFRYNDSTLTKLNESQLANGLIGLISKKPEEIPSFYNSRKDNKYNTFFWVFPIPEIDGYASNFASKFEIENEDGIQQPRGSIQIGCFSDGWANWVHEYFHIIERVMNITQKHVYYDENKSMWPDWYDETGGEDYYRMVFKKEGYINKTERFEHYFRPNCSLKYLKSFYEKRMKLIYEDVCEGGKDGVFTIEIESNDYVLSCSLKDENNEWARGHTKVHRKGDSYKLQITVPDEKKYIARINLKNEKGSYTTVAYFTIN